MFIIKNVCDHDVMVDGVAICPGEQLQWTTPISPSLQKAIDGGDIEIKDATETLEERKADVAAIHSLDSRHD